MGCSNPTEFQECWENMVDKFKLKRNQAYYRWFDRLYNLRDKWCTAISKYFFSAGILSSQRSESTNNAIGLEATKNTSLHQFFKIFQKNYWKMERKRDSIRDLLRNNNPNVCIQTYGFFTTCVRGVHSNIIQRLWTRFQDGYLIFNWTGYRHGR